MKVKLVYQKRRNFWALQIMWFQVLESSGLRECYETFMIQWELVLQLVIFLTGKFNIIRCKHRSLSKERCSLKLLATD